MKKTHTILNRHQLLDLAALQGWLEHNLIRFSAPINC